MLVTVASESRLPLESRPDVGVTARLMVRLACANAAPDIERMSVDSVSASTHLPIIVRIMVVDIVPPRFARWTRDIHFEQSGKSRAGKFARRRALHHWLYFCHQYPCSDMRQARENWLTEKPTSFCMKGKDFPKSLPCASLARLFALPYKSRPARLCQCFRTGSI